MRRENEITVCMRATRELPPIELSYKDVCSKCGHYVWISPGTKKSIEIGLYPETIVCVICAEKLVR